MKKIVLLLTIIATIALGGCNTQQAVPYSDTQFMLDTNITITLFKNDPDLMNQCFELISEYESRISTHLESSETYKLNHAGGEALELHNDTVFLISKALEYSVETGGLFDITVGPLVDLWDINNKNDGDILPSPEDIATAISLIDYKKVKINGYDVSLENKEMRIDLGAIAKGFIADRLVEFLTQKGIDKALINLGGNVYVLGTKPDGTEFKIGIQDPDTDRGDYMGIISLSNKSVVTSGTYERFFITDGIRYHHILDPRTGYPSNQDLKSVTIVSDTSIDGDALSTSVFLLGLKDGMNFVSQKEGVEAIFITNDDKVYITDGLIGNFSITQEAYTMGE